MQLSKNNTKETWKTINQIIRKPTHHTTFTKIKCTDTNIDLYDPKYISSCFNKYFSSVGSNLAHALPKASFSNSTNSIPSICSSMYIKPVYIEDIINEINQLDTNKCDDTYDIPVKIIKLSKVIIAPILCDLINNCINKVRPVGMGLPRAAWVKLNRLRTGVGRFHSSMHKWGLAPSPNCECGASEQTADHVLTMCPIHRAPHGARGLTVLDDETRCWLNNITASI